MSIVRALYAISARRLRGMATPAPSERSGSVARDAATSRTFPPSVNAAAAPAATPSMLRRVSVPSSGLPAIGASVSAWVQGHPVLPSGGGLSSRAKSGSCNCTARDVQIPRRRLMTILRLASLAQDLRSLGMTKSLRSLGMTRSAHGGEDASWRRDAEAPAPFYPERSTGDGALPPLLR